MSNSWYHAQSAARKWGDDPADYLPIEEFIDGSKQSFGDVCHRALYHHTQGVWLCQQIFGTTIAIKRQHGEIQVPVREIAERHIVEDLGYIPSPGDWLKNMNIQTSMGGQRHRFIGREELLNATLMEAAK
jgi:hypothetical protein